jgi:hypothetical protein
VADLQADLYFDMLKPSRAPVDRWCQAGHTAEETFELSETEVIPMRFFKVYGSVLPQRHHGIYCEACVVKARKMAEARKLG